MNNNSGGRDSTRCMDATKEEIKTTTGNNEEKSDKTEFAMAKFDFTAQKVFNLFYLTLIKF